MDYKFSNLLGAPYRGGTLLIHGSELLSPVGNRVSQIDLTQSTSSTLPFENGHQVRTLALSPDGRLLVSIDVEGRALVINRRRRALLHHFSFKDRVRSAAFSPDGAFLAVAVGRLVQVWRAPELRKSVAPLALHRTYGQAHADVTVLAWSPCSSWLAAGAEDLVVRPLSLNPIQGYRVPSLMGHRAPTVAVQFSSAAQREAAGLLGLPTPHLWTLAQDGALYTWTYEGGGAEEDRAGDGGGAEGPHQSHEYYGGHWRLASKYYFNQRGARLTAAAFHPEVGLLAAGFSNGVFDLLQLPDAVIVHTLSIGSQAINSLAWNAAGDWVAAGSAELGQLLVWEWRSETHALKQQGHAADVAAAAFSPDGGLLATAGDDARVKVWTPATGFCFVTFRDHAAPVTALAWLPTGHGLLSASLDGTVRAWDLVRYRCFRTLTTPDPAQFVSLALDPAGEVACAGTRDGFQVYVWSLKTGRLLDVLAGHEGPVVGLAFAPGAPLLASASWDGSVRTWDVFAGRGGVERLQHSHDVLALAWRPDARQLAAATLDGGVTLWDPHDAVVEGTISGRRDVAGGRLASDARTAGNTSSGRAFTSLAYSPDGALLFAGGASRYVCVYDVAERVLLRRFATTANASLDGVRDMLNSKNMSDAGPLDAINDGSDDDDLLPDTLARRDDDLPGARRVAVARVRAVALSPSGRSWAAATTSGVALYSLDAAGAAAFDPTDLAEGVTPEAALRALRSGAHLRALLLALRLGEAELTRHVLLSTPREHVPGVVRLLPPALAPGLLATLGVLLAASPHLELGLAWVRELARAHGAALSSGAGPALREVQRLLSATHADLAGLAEHNLGTLDYLVAAGGLAGVPEQAEAA
ncbi:UTP1 [Auxenochlorella protothecoides x Auxenochlorella symbiontica]